MYIALDLETTGFEPHTDQIIEIAAIKFDGKKIIDRFEALLNPGIPIPAMVTHITGIKNEDLADAPAFAQIHQDFLTFIGNYPIIGHNIGFDIGFLKQKGSTITNPLYDTLILAGMLLPDFPSYSLDTLSRLLKIEHKEKHRAMSDTEACYKLFLIMEEKIAELNPAAREEITEILSKGNWPLKDLFVLKKKAVNLKESAKPGKNDAQRIQGVNAQTSGYTTTETLESNHKTDGIMEQTPQEQTNEPEKKYSSPFPPGILTNFYDEKGPLAAVISPYEKRSVQQKMSEKILDAFEKRTHTLIEAGTGTGKTIAYLFSSIFWNTKQKEFARDARSPLEINNPSGLYEKIIISTYTHHLQNQILKNDIPLLHQALQKINPDFKINVAVLKGRKNYLSAQRLKIFKKKESLEDHETTFLIKILLWLQRSDTGDLSEINLQGKEMTLVDDICCQELICQHDDPEYKKGCYLLAARQKAALADLLIVNHSLLIQNEIAESPLLPAYLYLIIDEAHHLEKVATDALTITLSFNQFIKPYVNLHKTMNYLPATFRCLSSPLEYKKNLEHLIARIEIFFGLIGIFLEKELEPSKFQYQLNLTSSHLQGMEWKKIMDAANAILANNSEIIKNISDFLKKWDEENLQIKDAKSQKQINILQQFKAILYECEKRMNDLKKVIFRDESRSDILWINKSPEESITLKSAPLNVGDFIKTHILQKRNSVILTSATLTTNNSFEYIREQLGLDKNSGFEEMILPSHFQYPDQVKILIPEDLPEPATEGYFLSCATLIAEIIRKNKGRTLALFTSKKALSATFRHIAPTLKKEGFTVLGQNMTGGRGKILEHFKSEPQNCAILGTSSFWEGVDIKGSDLTCVIMQKLPFDPPDDPIISARCKKYIDSFNDYQVPRAILRFKQGFGRLIRSSYDTGSIVILDTRILQKNYGSKFLESLPRGIKIQYGTQKNLAELL